MKSILIGIATFLLRNIMKIIGASLRLKIEGRENLEEVLGRGQPVIFCFWHNRIFYMAWFLYYYAHKKNLPLSVLVSRSKDGDIIARLIRPSGVECVRGSTSRGGRTSLRRMAEAIQKSRSVVITPDGPRGPVYALQPGVVYLASLTGAPVVPVSSTFGSVWKFSSWDGFIIPRPLTRVKVHIGKPVFVNSGSLAADMEASRKKIEDFLLQFPELMADSRQ